MATPPLRPALLSCLAGAALGLLAWLPASAFGAAPVVPEWALPGSSTHVQVPPPAGFRRASTHYPTPIGIFAGQSDIGTALVPGSASFDPATGAYTLHSAGYNIWYFRDEFRYLWKKMTGDVSLAADISFPNPDGYGDRKVVLVFRQDLDDDSKEIMVALHGTGLIHLAQRPAKGTDIVEVCREAGSGPVGKNPVRIGIEKHGNRFTLYIGDKNGALHAVGTTAELKLDTPFYVGIGFTSHLPATVDTGVASQVVLVNRAGAMNAPRPAR